MNHLGLWWLSLFGELLVKSIRQIRFQFAKIQVLIIGGPHRPNQDAVAVDDMCCWNVTNDWNALLQPARGQWKLHDGDRCEAVLGLINCVLHCMAYARLGEISVRSKVVYIHNFDLLAYTFGLHFISLGSNYWWFWALIFLFIWFVDRSIPFISCYLLHNIGIGPPPQQ
jgi:hypothetical protein